MNDLDAVITELYDSIGFEAGRRPDWSRQERIFAPDARLVRITDDGVFEFTLRTYRENIERMIDSGALPSFCESEIWRETRQVGEMAHVLSAYEARWTRNGPPFHRGVNSIQLFQRDGHWRVSALLWRREGRAISIPDVPFQ
jgi:hypothetical protein